MNYEYDAHGRLVGFQDDNSNHLSVSYDEHHVAEACVTLGDSSLRTRHCDGRVTSVSASDGTEIVCVYDNAQGLVELNDDGHSLLFQYENDLLTRVASPDEFEVEYEYSTVDHPDFGHRSRLRALHVKQWIMN